MFKTLLVGILAIVVLSGCGAPARQPLDLATATTAAPINPVATSAPSAVPSPTDVRVPSTVTQAPPTESPAPLNETAVPPTETSLPPTDTPATAVPATPTLVLTPPVGQATATAGPNAIAGAVKILLVVGAKPGATASIAAQSTPNASCSIAVTTPRGRAITSRTLGPKTTDSNGQVTWAWKIPARLVVGTGSVAVTCGTASATAPIVVG